VNQMNFNPVIPMYFGPSTPPVFAGHVKSAGSVAPPSSDENVNVQFQLPTTVEGIHVVPKNITPLGFSIEGKTSPDINTRSFVLDVYAHGPDNSVQLLLALSIRGGVQWQPVPPPLNMFPATRLSFGGDFDVVSVIIHGAHFQIGQNLPFLSTNETKESHTAICKESAISVQLKKLNIDTDVLSKDHLKEAVASLALMPSQRYSNEFSQLFQFDSTLEQERCSKVYAGENYFVKDRKIYEKSTSLVAIQDVANLVGSIFSFVETESIVSEQDFHDRIASLHAINECFSACWRKQVSKVASMFLALNLCMFIL
jgi:hypothetical protein